jgi:hypothetical protein
MNYFKRVETGIIGVVIVVLAIAFGLLNEKANAPTLAENEGQVSGERVDSQPVSGFIRYPGQDGRTALDILKANHNVVVEDFGGVGEFVKAIDGVVPDSSHFWAFYVDGQQAQVGADTYQTKSSETIEWKLEEIK